MGLLSPLANVTASLGKAAHIPNLGISYLLNGNKGGGPDNIYGGLIQGGIHGQGTNSSIYNNPIYNAARGDNAQGVPQAASGSSGMAAGSPIAGATGSSAATNAAALSAAQNNIYGDQNTINGLYSAINGQIGALATQNTNNENNSYDTNVKGDNTAFQQGVDQTDAAYGARGAGDSSYESNDNITSNNNLQTDLGQLLQSHNSNLAKIGQFVASNQAQLNNKPSYNLSDYTDVPSLTSLHTQLGQYIQSLQSMQSGLGNTDSQNMAALQGITPLQSNFQSELNSQLANLAASSAAPAAKVGLAQGYLNSAGISPTDPTYAALLKQLGLNSATAAATPTAAAAPAATAPAAA